MTPSTEEDQVLLFKFMRNLLAGIGFAFFPLAAGLEAFVFGGPPSIRSTFIVIFTVAGLLLFAFSAVMEFVRRKALRGEIKPDDEIPRQRRLSLLEIVFVLAVSALMSVGFLWVIMDLEKSMIAEQLSQDAGAYDLSTAQPAESLVENMWGPVERAVQIKSADTSSVHGLVCAEGTSDDLEVFKIRKKAKSSELVNISMNGDLRAAASAFCDAAFVRAAAADPT